MDQRQFIAKIKTSNFFENLFERANKIAIIVHDKEGIISDINVAVTRSFGYTKQDVIGKHFSLLYTDSDLKRNLPDIELITVLQRGFAEDDNYIRHKDGSHIWTTGESTLVKDDEDNIFIVKIMRDINEQKLLEKFLKESKEINQTIIQSINEPLLVLDSNMIIEKANEAFYKTFYIESGRLEKLRLTDIMDRLWDDSGLKEPLNKVNKEGVEYRDIELELDIPELGCRTLNINIKPLVGNGHAKRKTLLSISDITERKNLEKRKDDFIRYTSHELRTPITSIKAYVQLLERCIKENKTCDLMEYINKTAGFVEKLNKLVTDLHDISKASIGKIQLNKIEFNFQHFLEDVIETTEIAYPTHKIVMTGDVNRRVYADRYKLQQVLTNYLTNAIKYSPQADQVMVHVSVEGKEIVVGVEDFGVGISAENISKLFGKFYRVTHTQKIEGLGLGLFISKKIIEAHYGKVWVESQEGKGSTFYFSLPLN